MSQSSGRFAGVVAAPKPRVEILSAEASEASPDGFDALFGCGAERAEVLTALAWAVWHGARTVRTNDIASAERICRTVEAVLDARGGS